MTEIYRQRYSLSLLAILSAALIFVVLMTHKANAETWSQQCDRTGCYNHFFDTQSSPRIIIVPEDESKEAQDRFRKWEAFCQPKAETRAHGVQYLVYAHEGCEYGKSE